MWKDGSDQVVLSLHCFFLSCRTALLTNKERVKECDSAVMYVAAEPGDGRHRDTRCHIHISPFFCHQLDFPSLPFPVTLDLSSIPSMMTPHLCASFSKIQHRKIVHGVSDKKGGNSSFGKRKKKTNMKDPLLNTEPKQMSSVQCTGSCIRVHMGPNT